MAGDSDTQAKAGSRKTRVADLIRETRGGPRGVDRTCQYNGPSESEMQVEPGIGKLVPITVSSVVAVFGWVWHARESLRKELGADIGKLGDKVDDHRERLVAVETRLGIVETRLGTIENKLDGIETKLDNMPAIMEAAVTKALEASKR